MVPFYSLDQVKGPEVVKMCDAQCETINTRDNERSDLPLFHEQQGCGGKGSAVDDVKAEIHDLVGNSVVSSRAVPFEQSSEVGIGDHADLGGAAGTDFMISMKNDWERIHRFDP